MLCDRRTETLFFQVSFEVLTLDLDGPTQLHARDLPAAQAPVDPALAHPELLAKLRYREQVQALPLLRTLLSLLTDGLFELQERALQLFEGFAVSSQGLPEPLQRAIAIHGFDCTTQAS